jgi:excisionase family DNA binding protein
MKVTELADYLKVHPTTIYRLVRLGAIPAFKIGNNWRFDAEIIDRWQSSQSPEVRTRERR